MSQERIVIEVGSAIDIGQYAAERETGKAEPTLRSRFTSPSTLEAGCNDAYDTDKGDPTDI